MSEAEDYLVEEAMSEAEDCPLHVFTGTKPPSPNIRNTCGTVHKTIHNLAIELNYRDDAQHNLIVAQQIQVLSAALVNLESIRRVKVRD